MNAGWLVKALFVVCAAVAVFAFASTVKDGEHRRAPETLVQYLDPQYTGQNRSAPDFDLVDQHGEHRHLSDYRGKTVVLHFWTRTCGPCIQEMQGAIPAFEEMVKDRQDLVLLMVSVDSGWAADAPVVPGTVHSTILFDPTRGVVAGKYGTRLFPETWVIDSHGVIRARFDHTLEWDSPLWINYLASIR
jgi:peroxiredoxin